MDELKEIKFEIVRKIGIISENGRGWRKELNIVSWNEREPKFDLRDWSEDHTRMGKGITLNPEEAARLNECLGAYLKKGLRG
jgi:hypothetical protein